MIPTAFAALYSWRFRHAFHAPAGSAESRNYKVLGRMQELKKELRDRAINLRKEAFAQHGIEASRLLAAHGLDFIKVRPGVIVSGFAAIRDEINPADLMLWLHAEGVRLALPVMVGKGKPLVMRAWTPGDVMEAAAWGIAEPTNDKPEVDPDVVLVPLLAFDERGYRLGYGGGFYDRTLAKLRAKRPVTAVGIAYDEQKVDAVPFESYDQRLDWVLTPSGPKKCEV
jgi:5-formyltetrahydrofolate cyclo-ligase